MSNIPADMKKTINAIEKEYGDGVICQADEALALDIDRLRTGSFSLDVETGGGVPENRITLLGGREGGGKSTLACKIVGSALQKYPEKYGVYVDSEHSFDKDWAKHHGIDLSRLQVVRPEYAEQAFEIVDNLVRNDDVCIAVVDSVTSLAAATEVSGSMEDQQMGLNARINNKFLRKFNSALSAKRNLNENENNTTLVLIAQVRKKIGSWGDPEVIPGGHGLIHWASLIIKLQGGDWIEKSVRGNKINVAKEVKFYIEKNKTYSPKKKGTFDLYVAEHEGIKKGEIDTVKELVSYAIYWDLVTKRGAWYYVDGREDGFHGAKKLVDFFKNNPDEKTKLENKVMAEAIEYKKEDEFEDSIVEKLKDEDEEGVDNDSETD